MPSICSRPETSFGVSHAAPSGYWDAWAPPSTANVRLGISARRSGSAAAARLRRRVGNRNQVSSRHPAAARLPSCRRASPILRTVLSQPFPACPWNGASNGGLATLPVSFAIVEAATAAMTSSRRSLPSRRRENACGPDRRCAQAFRSASSPQSRARRAYFLLAGGRRRSRRLRPDPAPPSVQARYGTRQPRRKRSSPGW